MPAQFEIIYPDKTVSFVVPTRAGEPLYIGCDAAGVLGLSPDATGDPFAMLLEGESGVVEVSAFVPGSVLVDGAPLQGTKQLASHAEIRVDEHTFIVFSDGASANGLATSEAKPNATSAKDRPRVFVADMRQTNNRDGTLVYAVTARTSGSEAAYEPKVILHAEVGQLQGTFIPLTEAQRRFVTLTFPHGHTLNMQHSDTQIVELQVKLEPSSQVLAGDYRLRVMAAFEHESGSPDDAADAPLTVPAFSRFRMDDPVPMRHVFPRYRSWPATKSTVAITNLGNVVTPFSMQVENAPNSDCRATLILLPRVETQAGLIDTSALEASPQSQQLQGLDIHPNETRYVRVSLAAQGQPIASLRHSHHQVNVSVSAQGVSPISKSIRLVTVPLLLGPVRMLLLLLLIALILRNHVVAMNDHTGFHLNVAQENAACPQATSQIPINRQQRVTLTICTVPFTDVKLEKRALNATPEVSAITEPTKTISFLADRSVSYRLIAAHPLGRLLPWPPFVIERSIDLDMSIRRTPTGKLVVQPLNVPAGGEVKVFWNNVDQAKSLTLYENDAPNVIPVDSITAGQMKFTLAQKTTFRLVAISETGEQQEWWQVVNIDVPRIAPTSLPTPAITRFDVSPSQVVSGQQVLLQWEVAGPPDAVTVTLFTNGVPAIVPASAAIYQMPQDDGSSVRIYALTATNGRETASAMRQVQVLIPTPVPTPTPGPVGAPDYDLACGGVGRSDLIQLGEHWVWVCRDNPLADISNKVCQDQYGEKAFANAKDVGKKETWMCWR